MTNMQKLVNPAWCVHVHMALLSISKQRATIKRVEFALLHLSKVLGNVELGASVLLDVLDCDIRSQLGERQLALLPVHFEHTLIQKSAHFKFHSPELRLSLPDP